MTERGQGQHLRQAGIPEGYWPLCSVRSSQTSLLSTNHRQTTSRAEFPISLYEGGHPLVLVSQCSPQ